MRRIGRVLLVVVVSGLAGYVTWDRVEVYRLNRVIAAVAARGEPTELSDADSPPTTPQAEEAAQAYIEAAARAREMAQQDGRLMRIDVDAVVGRIDVDELETSFRKDAPALQLLDRATPLPFTGFGDAVEPPGWANAQGLETLSMLAALRADLLAYRGEGDAAAASLAAAVRVQRTLREVFYKSGIAIRQFGSLRVLLRHAAPSASALDALQRAFAEMPDDDLIEQDLERRRALLIESREDSINARDLSSLAIVAFHPFLVRRVRQEIEQFPEVMAVAREPWPQKLTTLTALASTGPRPASGSALRQLLTEPPVHLAALSSSPAAAGRRLAVRRLAIATLAIERYRRDHAGAAPADLAALVPRYLEAVPIDPFSGKPPVYRPSARSYRLYSLDANRIDDDGALYGLGSLNPMPLPRARDFGIDVPLTPLGKAQ